MELDVRQLGELGLEHLLGDVQHEIAALALADAAEDHHVVDLVELGVLCQRVAQVHPDGLIEVLHFGSLAGIGHGLLDHLQALSMVLVLDRNHVWIGILVLLRNLADLGRKLCGTALSQVHVRHTAVRALGPRIGWRLRVQVQPDVAHLVDPAHQVAIAIGIPAAFAAAHGNAKDVALTDLLHRCQGCDFAVVDHLQWHVAGNFLGHSDEDVDNFGLVHIWGHIWENVTPSGLVGAADGAGGTSTNRINPGECLLGEFERVHDHLVVVVWIRIGDVPFGFL
mmetsp:Transcript_13656/g.38913  ORF Transcript_13656/g.38913 Transcript_13656/m.38913 type:complete len:281 (-) Transcript_13656:645-1487(-)